MIQAAAEEFSFGSYVAVMGIPPLMIELPSDPFVPTDGYLWGFWDISRGARRTGDAKSRTVTTLNYHIGT